jgi:hypothetical protein
MQHLMYMMICFVVCKCWEFLDWLNNCQSLNKNVALWN